MDQSLVSVYEALTLTVVGFATSAPEMDAVFDTVDTVMDAFWMV